MVAHSSRTVTTTLTCGHTVTSQPGTYVTTCPHGCPQMRPDRLTPSRRGR
jgi:hypothetical protein